MRLRSNQLENELKKGLKPVYLISGDEPLLMQETLDTIRLACKQQAYDERKILEVDRKFEWTSLLEESNTLSLFSERILTELRLGSSKPGIPGGKTLQAYCKDLPEDKILLISANKLDAASLKAKWCNEIDRVGVIVQIWPVQLNEMPQWLNQRARKIGLNLNQEAIELLTDRLEGNLLAAQQELEKLRLLFPASEQAITADAILESVADASKYDIFNLTDACLKGDTKLSIKIQGNLKLEGIEPTIVLWALSKEIRTLAALSRATLKNENHQSIFSAQRVFPKRQPLLSQASSRLNLSQLQDMLAQCKLVDDLIKGAKKGIDPWDILLDISLALCGTHLSLKASR